MKNKKWLYSCLESIILTVIVSYFFHNNYNFLTLNLHPLLIITAVITLRYGRWPGLMSAFISSISYTYIYLLADKSFYLLFTEFSNYKFFLMFFLTAVILGRFKDNYQIKINNLEEEKEKLIEDNKELNNNLEEVTFIKDEIKKQIVGAEHSILSLYEMAQSLESLEPESLYTEVMKVFKKFLEAEIISLYTLDKENDFLRLKLRVGGKSEMDNSIELAKYPCLNRVIQQKETSKRHNGCPYSKQRAVFVAPIIDRGQVLGIVNIEEIEFTKITDYSYQLFKVIMDWLNNSLAKAISYEEKIANEKYYGETSIMKYSFFEKRLNEEEKREKEFKMDFQILAYENRAELDLINIDNIFSGLIRKTDVMAYDKKEKIIYLLFPATHAEYMGIIKKRINSKIGDKLEMVHL